MKMCQKHWDAMRKSIDDRGMSGLVSPTPDAVMEAISGSINGEKDTPFDPLLSMNFHWFSSAIQDGGIYLLNVDENGNPYCPICEYERNQEGFVAEEAIGLVADQIRDYCLAEGMIPPLQ